MSDLIQRQDAINAIEAEIDDLDEHIKKTKLCIGKDAEWIERFADYRRDGLIDAVMSIESLPSAEIKAESATLNNNGITFSYRKTGKWILTPMLSDNYRYECSICNSHHRERYDYCPSCGAKMR